MGMFQYKICTEDNCTHPVFFNTEKCFQHLENKELCMSELLQYFNEQKIISKLDLTGLILENYDFSGKTFFLCNIAKATFNNVIFKNTKMDLVFFDFSTFVNCNFQDSYMTNTVFAGSTITNCDFSGSELNRNNFVGILVRDSKFSSSDLYSSRFINSNLINVEFVDCNLKRVNFKRSSLQGINFRSSNSEEAYFDGEI